MQQGKYQEAITVLKKMLVSAGESKASSEIAFILQNIGYASTRLKEFNETKEWFDKAGKIAIQNNDQYLLGKIYNHWASYDSAVGNLEQAFEHKSKFFVISDRLLNEKLRSQLTELQLKNDAKRKNI